MRSAEYDTVFELFSNWAQPKMSEFTREVYQEHRNEILDVYFRDKQDIDFSKKLELTRKIADKIFKPEFKSKVKELLDMWSNETMDEFNSFLLTREEYKKRMTFVPYAIKIIEEAL